MKINKISDKIFLYSILLLVFFQKIECGRWNRFFKSLFFTANERIKNPEFKKALCGFFLSLYINQENIKVAEENFQKSLKKQQEEEKRVELLFQNIIKERIESAKAELYLLKTNPKYKRLYYEIYTDFDREIKKLNSLYHDSLIVYDLADLVEPKSNFINNKKKFDAIIENIDNYIRRMSQY